MDESESPADPGKPPIEPEMAERLNDYAHALNNAITVIQTSAELLQIKSPDFEGAKENWEEMMLALQRATDLSKQITTEVKPHC